MQTYSNLDLVNTPLQISNESTNCLSGLKKSQHSPLRLKCYVTTILTNGHDDVIKWKHFPRNWPFVRGIHWSTVNSPHKGQWRGALMFSLICIWRNDWVNNREAGDLRRYRAHYGVILMCKITNKFIFSYKNVRFLPYWIYRLVIWLSKHLGFYSVSGKTSYRKISWSIEAARFRFRLFHPSEIWLAFRQQCCR